MGLREVIEADLGETLEGDFALPVVLIAPDGTVDSVTGQILYDTLVEDPEDGSQQIVHKPVVTVRRTSLARVPEAGEDWAVQIPTVPDATASTVTYKLERPSEDGGSIGFIRLYLMKAAQS